MTVRGRQEHHLLHIDMGMAALLGDQFPGSRHVRDVGFRGATDQDLWNCPLAWLPWDPAQTLLGWPCVGRAHLAGAAANGAAPDL